ncbi:hypothetical protein RSAG8_07461, partial [Rhizoctonia solani AG-8 WAC10335]
MDFGREWGTGPVFNWCRRLQESSVSVERLQVRIDRGTPPHRFVVAYLRGTRRVCRFDRRPETPKPGTLFLEMLGAPTRKAADEWTLYEPEEWADSNLDSSTHCELDMGLPTHTNLLLILAACYALATDTKVCNYELFRYNCYFFSWTITMIVARHTLPLVPPSPERVVQSTSLPAEIGHIAGSVAEGTTTGLIEMVLDTITAVRTTTDKALNPGLGKRFKLQLRAGLETRSRARVRVQLEQSAKQVLDEILSKQNSAKKLSLLIKVMWGAILDIVAEGYGSPEPGDLIQKLKHHPKLPYRMKYYLFAARRATSDLTKLDQFSSEEERHKAVFNAAFLAAKGAALVSAKAVVARTSASMKNDKREKMWGLIWELGLMKQSVEDVVGVGATAIVAAVEHDQTGCLRASITPVAHVGITRTTCEEHNFG